jgi:5'-nucleotidase
MIGDTSVRIIPPQQILFTNDDGRASPFVAPFIRNVKQQTWCEKLLTVLPAEEQSWISHAVTRFRPVFTHAEVFGEESAVIVSGTPADCACLGIFNLSAHKPSFVLSGPNMGTNAGTAFMTSSGTLAAASFAAACGVRGIAISVDVPQHVFNFWSQHDDHALAQLQAEFDNCSRVALRTAELLLSESKHWESADYFSINVPWSCDQNTEVKFTRPARTIFHGLYKETAPGKFYHKFAGLDVLEGPTGTDIEALMEQKISITAMRLGLQTS